MALVTASDLSVAYNGVSVLKNVDLVVHPDSRLGIVGANGSGKTTLLRILLGEAEADDGTVDVRRGIRIEWLKQETVLDRALTPREIVLEGFADVLAVEKRLRDVENAMGEPGREAELDTLMAKHSRLQAELEALGGYEVGRRAEEALSGLGVRTEDHERPLGLLSGGQQTRVALARVLVRQPDLLVLDEPTNHLDVEATVWLENKLAAWPGAFIVISHDRYFLDEVAQTIGELEEARLTLYPGNYTAYRKQREVRVKTMEKAFEKQQREIAHAEDFIAKNLAAQRVSMARGRQKMLARMDRVDSAPRDAKKLKLDLGEGKGGQGDVVTLDRVGHAFEEDRWLFRNVSFRFERGERIGILGPNGGGKTTLLRIFADLLEPAEGNRREGKAVQVGVFEQERSDLDPEMTPLEVMREVDPRTTDGALRSWLGRFRVSGDDALRPVKTLSGGEASRVALARLLYAGPNALFLDEPTNHLDIPAREALEEALADFPGSVLLVSHDRRFLDRTVGRIMLVADGAVRTFFGGYTAYQEQIAKEREEARAAAEAAEKRRRAERKKQVESKSKGPKKPRLEDVEAGIITREERLKEILEEMGQEHIYRNADLMRELSREKETLETELETLEEQWADLAG